MVSLLKGYGFVSQCPQCICTSNQRGVFPTSHCHTCFGSRRVILTFQSLIGRNEPRGTQHLVKQHCRAELTRYRGRCAEGVLVDSHLCLVDMRRVNTHFRFPLVSSHTPPSAPCLMLIGLRVGSCDVGAIQAKHAHLLMLWGNIGALLV